MSIRSVLQHVSEPVVIHFIGFQPLPSFPEVHFVPLSAASALYDLERFTNPIVEFRKAKNGNLNAHANYVRFILPELFPEVCAANNRHGRI